VNLTMQMNPTLFVLADDVTGAADCAARCKSAGLPATILIEPMLIEPTMRPLPTGAVAFSSDSRFLPPAQAAEQVQTIFRTLQQAASQPADAIWYKKIDSTLRGNIGAELAAMMTLTSAVKSRPCAVIAPAFPAQGRGLVDGNLVYAQATQSLSLPKLIAEQTALPQVLVGLATVRAGVAELTRHFQAHYATGAQLFVADALTDADLQTLYTAAQVALPQALFCGSAGLMGVIAATLVAAQGGKPASADQPPPTIARPLLAVVGSGSVMAQRQLMRLRQLPALDLYQVDPDTPAKISMIAGSGDNHHCALRLPPPVANAQLDGETARQYAATLGAAALAQIQQRRPRALLLVGGDTTFYLLHLLGITALQVEAELFPGMPLTTGLTADGQRYQIILKAGNHGDEETLATLFTWS
jgi:4-hydroxythreonine-4-phosphate dehydrogenase